MFGSSILLVTEGRPLGNNRRERGAGDLIAGEDFLSILMGPKMMNGHRRHHQQRMEAEELEEPTTTTEPITTTTVRFREVATERTFAEESTEAINSDDLLTNQVNVDYSSSSSRESTPSSSSSSTSARNINNNNDGMIISVRVSSSVGRRRYKQRDNNKVATTTVATKEELVDADPVAEVGSYKQRLRGGDVAKLATTVDEAKFVDRGISYSARRGDEAKHETTTAEAILREEANLLTTTAEAIAYIEEHPIRNRNKCVVKDVDTARAEVTPIDELVGSNENIASEEEANRSNKFIEEQEAVNNKFRIEEAIATEDKIEAAASNNKLLFEDEYDIVGDETTTTIDAIPIEDHPSIIAEANKSEFSVEEGEPITSNSDFEHNPASPYQGTIIYHNREPSRARSVSYSTVIQAIPNIAKWSNITDNNKPVPSSSSVAESKDYYVTSKYNPPDYNESLEKRYESSSRRYYDTAGAGDVNNWNNYQKYVAPKPQQPYNSANSAVGYNAVINPAINTAGSTGINGRLNAGISSGVHEGINAGVVGGNNGGINRGIDVGINRGITGSINRGVNAGALRSGANAGVYPQPEQNYEVDEAVSVETNGRAHGVQHQQQQQQAVDSKKKDDNQKVGYVVEGRNYRKYRVEERTSDGFIVGEYGVVSHDDGSLRGVRYTADGTISPRLIYDALMKFLAL